MSDTTAAAAKAETVDPTQPPGESPSRSPLKLLGGLDQGDLGLLRTVLAIALVWAIFQTQNENFLTAGNLTNLMLQVTAVGLISVGVVLVLLLGEIDLSVGSVSGLCASIMAVLNIKNGWDPVLAILAALAAGAAVGLITGFFVNAFQIPSFVVTLAGLIGWQGLQLQVLGKNGTINLPLEKTISNLTFTFYSDAVGWALAVAASVLLVGAGLWKRRRRAAGGLPVGDIAGFALRSGLVVAAIIGSTWVFLSDRGMPLAVLILIAAVAIFAFITTRTRFGRHIYAVGGNAEAARRSGINVGRVRMAVFVISSTMAAAGGIMAASRGLAVSQSSGGSDLLLLAIAGPVVAGTSLFGGRGTVWAALLGAVLIGSITNGMNLLSLPSPVRLMITGAVLLAAVVIDAVSSRRQQVRRA
jgi:D-xylose transport system permease protein